MRLPALKAALFVSALAATPALAADGYASCMGLNKEDGRMFYSNPVPADQAKTDALGMQYGTMLKDKGYAAKSMYAPKDAPDPVIQVDCRWNKDSAGAKAWTDQVTAGAGGRGFKVLGVPFTPQ